VPFLYPALNAWAQPPPKAVGCSPLVRRSFAVFFELKPGDHVILADPSIVSEVFDVK